MRHIAIIGNGIAGTTAARFLRKINSSCRITMISAETDHFFSRTALMYIYMGHMRYEDTKPYEDWFWKKNRIDLIRAYVETIDFQSSTLLLKAVEGSPASLPRKVPYDDLIIACGSTPNFFGWPGQEFEGVRGLVSKQDLDYLEKQTPKIKHAVIVGGGLIGVELAEMLHSRNIPVTFLVRESCFWNRTLPPEESAMVSRHIRKHGIDLKLSTELREIKGDEHGMVRSVISSKDEIIDCQYVGITTGVHPNVEWLRKSPGHPEIKRGITVNEFLQTDIPNVYAIGDCAELKEYRKGRRSIEAIWYTGRIMGETVAHNIFDHKVVYDPGIWFNSAKFFDIEYQVYGNCPPDISDPIDCIYWEHSGGEKSIRICYNKRDMAVCGFTLMGIRYRHELCERWIANHTPLKEVVRDLEAANFDPEFYKTYEPGIRRIYAEKTGEKIERKFSRGVRSFLRVFNKLKEAETHAK
jgi:NADPH-dependent 2,4-dienoyl-CoA reductase/sulfur reductase-like enzyme